MRGPDWAWPSGLHPPIPGAASLVGRWSRLSKLRPGLAPGQWVNSRQVVKEGEEDKVEVLRLVEVAGVACISQLHHRVVGQVAELPQRLPGQDTVQLPIQDESRGLQGKARGCDPGV